MKNIKNQRAGESPKTLNDNRTKANVIKMKEFLSKKNLILQIILMYIPLIIRSRKPRITAVGIRYADHATPSIRKSWH
jgi:hypothetical protein